MLCIYIILAKTTPLFHSVASSCCRTRAIRVKRLNAVEWTLVFLFRCYACLVSCLTVFPFWPPPSKPINSFDFAIFHPLYLLPRHWNHGSICSSLIRSIHSAYHELFSFPFQFCCQFPDPAIQVDTTSFSLPLSRFLHSCCHGSVIS